MYLLLLRFARKFFGRNNLSLVEFSNFFNLKHLSSLLFKKMYVNENVCKWKLNFYELICNEYITELLIALTLIFFLENTLCPYDVSLIVNFDDNFTEKLFITKCYERSLHSIVLHMILKRECKKENLKNFSVWLSLPWFSCFHHLYNKRIVRIPNN